MALLASAFTANAGGADDRGLQGLLLSVYRLEVAGYCSLVDQSVAGGFRKERDRIIHRDRLDAEQVEQIRMSAWQLAHAEWQNRGLGGFKNWCRTEGEDAARHFRQVFDGSVRDD